MNTKKFQLKNGLTVLLVESHKAPVVSVQMWVRTGSIDERKGEEGISHFIEHLVFKGTRKFKVGEIASVIEGSGGELNAYTSFDQTVFYVTISKQFVDTGLLAIAEMMGFPLFDKTEIDNEREVVIEEIKRGQDSLGRRASQLMFSTAFQKHPYRIPVIGFEKNIREVTPKTLEKYFHSRYCPRNMFLVVSGDFNSAEMKAKVSELYGEFKDHKVRPSKKLKEPPQKMPRTAVEQANFEQSVGYITWKIPGLKHKDTPALEVLATVLGQGDTSRLVQKLRIENAIVNSIGASSFAPEDLGVFLMSFGYQKENLIAALDGILETMKEFFNRPIDPSEIERTLINYESDKYFSVETVDGIARNIGTQWLVAKDLKFNEKFTKKTRKVRAPDLYRVAKKYLQPATISAAFVGNAKTEETQAAIDEWIKKYSIWYKSLKLKAHKQKAPKLPKMVSKLGRSIDSTERILLNNGVTVLLRPSKETHLVSIKSAFLGGLRQETEAEGGLTELLARAWSTGTESRTEQEIYELSESLATSVSPIAGRNSIGLAMDVLVPFEAKASDLYLDSLTAPSFLEEPLEREKMVQLRDIKTKQDSPSSQVSRDFMKEMFSGHPYSRDLLGEQETLTKLGRAQVQKHWQQIALRKNLTIVVAGNLNKAMWLKKIEKYTDKLPSGSRVAKSHTIQDLSKEKKTFTKSDKEQSHVIYGFRGLKITDPERYTLQIIQSILAGQGGRLFLELRDKNSLAYSVSPVRLEGLEVGYFGAYIGCSPEKVDKAISMMKEQFDLLMKKPVDEQELLRSQRYLVGRHDIDLQRTSAISGAILYDDIYGIDYNEPFTAAAKYFAVNSKMVQDLAQRILAQPPVISVVGPQDPWS